MRRRMRIAALILAAGGVWTTVVAAATIEPPVTRTSRPVRLLRTWEDTVKGQDGAEYARRVELVFDYARGYARENYYAADGTLLGSRKIKQNQPRPSPEEIEEAAGLIRSDPELARVIRRRSARFSAGFILEESNGLPCGPGARCLQMQILTSDQRGLMRWTVVDLARRAIVYRVYLPKAANP